MNANAGSQYCGSGVEVSNLVDRNKPWKTAATDHLLVVTCSDHSCELKGEMMAIKRNEARKVNEYILLGRNFDLDDPADALD